MTISGHEMTVLDGEAIVINQEKWDNQTLYREMRPSAEKIVKIRLIPYYAWDNRGIDDMSLWLNLAQ